MNLAFLSMDLLWRNALAALPLALAVAVICRFVRCRPSTRHALWLIVLFSLLAPPLLPALDFSDDLGRSAFFASIAQPPIDPPKPTSRGEAQLEGATAPPAILNTSPSVVEPRMHAGAHGSESIGAANEREREGEAPLLTFSHLPPFPFSEPAIALPTDIDTQTQLPASSSSTSTASDGSPTALRTSAGLPDSSAARVREQESGIRSQESRVRSQGSGDSSALAAPSFSRTAAGIEWRNWLARLNTVRDALARLAPIPTSLWLGGCVLLVLIMAVRIGRFRRLLNRATPAEPAIVQLVRDCAESIELRPSMMPRVLMTERSVSPLVWCGMRRILLLPEQLWGELDEPGRRAVLLHELAHLKRRDHWVCWVEMIVCTLYWWNPLAWWVRHRLRDEADYCCDAWVTAVLPHGRTSYARALLATRQYLTDNLPRAATPVLALGATTARTKRFARRLTMVMTERSMPRLSVFGSALALCLAAGAWLSTPLWACPPEESTNTAAKVKVAKPAKVKVPHVVVAQQGAVDVIAPEDVTTFEEHMLTRDGDPVLLQMVQAAPDGRGVGGGGAGPGLEGRISRLEERLDRLSEQLGMLLQQGGRGGTIARTAPPTPPAPPAAAMAPARARQPAPSAPRAMAGGGGVGSGPVVTAPAAQDGGEVIIRFYALPEDKASALFEFMRRDDVPVLVAQRDDGIEVHATARQHEVFAAFVRMIHPGAEIEGMGGMREMDRAAEELRMAAAIARDQQGAAAGEQRRAIESRLRQSRDQFQRTRQQQSEQLRRSFQEQHETAQKQREQTRKRVDELMRKSEELRHKAEDIESKADQMEDGTEKEELVAKIDALNAQADELEAQAESQEEQLEAQLEALEDQLDAQEEALEAQLEAQEEALEAELEAQLAALEAQPTPSSGGAR